MPIRATMAVNGCEALLRLRPNLLSEYTHHLRPTKCTGFAAMQYNEPAHQKGDLTAVSPTRAKALSPNKSRRTRVRFRAGSALAATFGQWRHRQSGTTQIPTPKSIPNERVVKSENTERAPFTDAPAKPNRWHSEGKPNATRSQWEGKKIDSSHVRSSRKWVPPRLRAVITLVSRSICSKSLAFANATLFPTGLSS